MDVMVFLNLTEQKMPMDPAKNVIANIYAMKTSRLFHLIPPYRKPSDMAGRLQNVKSII